MESVGFPNWRPKVVIATGTKAQTLNTNKALILFIAEVAGQPVLVALQPKQ